MKATLILILLISVAGFVNQEDTRKATADCIPSYINTLGAQYCKKKDRCYAKYKTQLGVRIKDIDCELYEAYDYWIKEGGQWDEKPQQQ